MKPALEALERLRAGNGRFVSDSLDYCSLPSNRSRRKELMAGQAPFAVILGCSDSRVPAEIVFDQGLGDLFVIRVAGNIVGPSQVGSVEFAAQHFGTRLVVVLGHTHCGAVTATLEALRYSADCPSPEVCSIVHRIRPSVESVLKVDPTQDREKLLQRAVRANIRSSVHQLREKSLILQPLIQEGRVVIVGAEYSIETGIVDFFKE